MASETDFSVRITTIKYKIDVWYLLSCLDIVKDLYNARGCATTCLKCGDRVFILQTYYEKPEE